jgi:hypothetical protein
VLIDNKGHNYIREQPDFELTMSSPILLISSLISASTISFSGPYRVVVRWSHNFYSVRLPAGHEYLFHVSRLRPYARRGASP